MPFLNGLGGYSDLWGIHALPLTTDNVEETYFRPQESYRNGKQTHNRKRLLCAVKRSLTRDCVPYQLPQRAMSLRGEHIR